MKPERSDGLQIPKALFSLFAELDTVFNEFPAFDKHKCPAGVSLGRIYREYKECKKELQRAAKRGEPSR